MPLYLAKLIDRPRGHATVALGPGQGFAIAAQQARAIVADSEAARLRNFLLFSVVRTAPLRPNLRVSK